MRGSFKPISLSTYVFIKRELYKATPLPPPPLPALAGERLRGQHQWGCIPLPGVGYSLCHSHAACWVSSGPWNVGPPSPCLVSRPGPGWRRQPRGYLTHAYPCFPFHRPAYSVTLPEGFLCPQQGARSPGRPDQACWEFLPSTSVGGNWQVHLPASGPVCGGDKAKQTPSHLPDVPSGKESRVTCSFNAV